MSMKKIIVFFIYMSGYFNGCTIADQFTLNEYDGVWYHVATIYPPNNIPPFTCVWSKIIKQKNSDIEFNEIFKTMASGKWLESQGHGKIINSELQFSHPAIGLNTSVYDVTKYNDGKEVILHNKLSTIHSSLLSRSTTASDEAKAAFEKKAAGAHAKVTYIDQNNCSG